MTDSDSTRGERDLDRTNTRTQEERREDAKKSWKTDPISQYKKKKQESITDTDLGQRIKEIERFKQYLINRVAEETEYEIYGPRDAVTEDVENYIEDVLKPDTDINNNTIVDYLTFINQFYKELNKQKAYAGNPVEDPLQEFRDNHDTEPDRPYIPFNRLCLFMNWLDLPFSQAFWLLGFKLGIRTGETINIDLRCLNIDHPAFTQVVKNHDVRLDPRIRDKPDSVLIYGHFNKGEEIPTGDMPGPEMGGEVRKVGNKRNQDNGSILPLDSELKTALIQWLLVRPSTEHIDSECHPLFTIGTAYVGRISADAVGDRLWRVNSYPDSIRKYATEQTLNGEDCPSCGTGQLIEANLTSTDKPGRRFRCQKCNEVYWRSIYWHDDLETEQKITYHQGRHTFSSAHSPENTGLHGEYIPDNIRKKEIRGDSNKEGDTEDTTYIEDKYKDFNDDVRKPYLDGIYKFGVYDNPIPAIGEGWGR